MEYHERCIVVNAIGSCFEEEYLDDIAKAVKEQRALIATRKNPPDLPPKWLKAKKEMVEKIERASWLCAGVPAPCGCIIEDGRILPCDKHA